jgi:pimeloyl-ACP methyl ester carboxylesterase
MIQAKTGYVDVGDGKVYYEIAGQTTSGKDPLVFLHAVPFDSRMWKAQWDDFRQRYKVIRYDLLGFGMSDPLNRPVSRRQELYRVLEETGVNRVVLVGSSLSGETILDVALERPELVSGLIVVSAVPGGFEMQGEPPKELLDMMAAFEQGDLELTSELQLRIWIDGPFRQQEQVDHLVRQRAAEMTRNTLTKGAWTFSFAPDPAPLDPPAAQRLDQINAPALIVAGRLDNPELLRAAGVMASQIPDAKQVIIPDAAHLLNMEKPAELNQAVDDFLSDSLGNAM